MIEQKTTNSRSAEGEARIAELQALLDAKTTPGYEFLAGECEKKDERIAWLETIADQHDKDATDMRYQRDTAESELSTLRERVKVLEGALGRLEGEVSGMLRAFEYELRESMGNTNYAVMQVRLEEARAALSHPGTEAR